VLNRGDADRCNVSFLRWCIPIVIAFVFSAYAVFRYLLLDYNVARTKLPEALKITPGQKSVQPILLREPLSF
jgi:hypothetical protein